MFNPAPDPYPGPNSGQPIIYVSYSYDTPAAWKSGAHKGELIRGWWFRCTVHANGHRACVLFRR